MECVEIPSTVDQAVDRLVQIDGIVTARGWERAAIVWAFTSEDDQPVNNDQKISFRTLAAEWKIPGLLSHVSVAKYHDAWQNAIDAGHAKPVAPGERVVIPDLPWPLPPHAEAKLGEGRRAAIKAVVGDSGPSVASVAQVMGQPAAVAAAIRANPDLAVLAEQAIRDRRREHPDETPPAPPQSVVPPGPETEPRQPNPLMWAIEVTRVVRGTDKIVAAGATVGPLNDDVIELLDEAASRLEANAGWLRTFARGDAINDESLHAWLSEGNTR